MSQAIANPLKAENFWAEMRSTAYLFSKSSWPSNEQVSRLISELRHILGKRILIYPQTFSEFGIGPETPYHLKKSFLGLEQSYNNGDTEEADKRFIKFMANKTALAQKGNWCWRITEEAEQKQLQGWYPFFVTLTVDPKLYDAEKLWKEGKAFRTYIRDLAEISAACLGHPPPRKKTKQFHYRPESDYVQYAGVIEHGKSQEHHHGHFMIWMKEIPNHWKIDPNTGRHPQYRFERENKCMRYLWPYCIASQKPALYFRSKGDIWSKMGHTNPIDKKTGKVIKINPVGAVGNYVTKYMQKGTKIWNHRMKCTRGLGLNRLRTIINQMDQKQLTPLTWKPSCSRQHHSVSLTHGAPIGLIRSIAKRKLFSIQWEKKQLELTNVMKTNYDHYKKMLKSVRDGVRPDRMPSTEFYDWVQSFLPETEGYSEEKLLKSHKLLSRHFPRECHKITPIVFGANQIGFTQCI